MSFDRWILRFSAFFAVLLCAVPSALAANASEDLDLDALFNTSQVGIATKRVQSTQDAPAIVEVINSDEIRERGYLSVAEALRAVPGFYVVDDHLLPNLGVRGISSGQRSWSRIVKLMIDGQAVPFRPDGSNWLGRELIPISLVKRIEIIRGPSSALYGADAFLGVINVVTKRGADLDGTRVDTAAGVRASYPNEQLAFTVGAVPDLAGLDLSVGGSLAKADRSGLAIPSSSPQLSAFAGNASLASANDLSSPGSFFARASMAPSGGLDLSIDTGYQHLDSGGEFQDWKPLTHQNQISEENRYIRAQAHQALSKLLSFSSSLAYSHGNPAPDDRFSIGRSDYYIQRQFSADGWDLASDLTWAFDDRNTLSVGADWDRAAEFLPTYLDVFTTGSLAGSTRPDGPPGGFAMLDNVGTYVQGIYYPLDQLGVTLNVRDDVQNIYGNDLNSRVGLVYRINDTTVAKALYGTSFKAPSAPQLFGKPLIYGDILGNQDLKPERASTLEGAISYLPSRAFDVTSSLYYTHVADKVSFFTRNGNPFAVNLGQLDSAGVESALNWRWSFLHGLFNTSLQETVPTTPQGFQDPNGDIEPYPDWMVNAGLGAPLKGLPLNAFVEARYVGWVASSQSNFVSNGHEPYSLAPAFIADFTLTSHDLYWFGDKETVLSLKVSNLLDTPYAQPGYGGIDYPGFGRTFLLSISQGF